MYSTDIEAIWTVKMQNHQNISLQDPKILNNNMKNIYNLSYEVLMVKKVKVATFWP